jgi:tetratricopeptide (TPR) repeat protein
VRYMYEKMGFREGQVDTLVALGMLARNTDDFDKAERHMTDALTLAQEIGNPRLLYDTLLSRGDVYLLANKLRTAAKDYTAAVTEVEAMRVNLLLEEEAFGFFDEPRLEVYDRLVRLYARGLSAPKQAQMWVERTKAREFLRRLRLSEILHTEQVPQELLAQEAQLLTQMKQAATALAETGQDRLSVLKDYQAAEKNLQSLWEKIEPFDREYVSLRKGEPISWKELKHLLKNS